MTIGSHPDSADYLSAVSNRTVVDCPSIGGQCDQFQLPAGVTIPSKQPAYVTISSTYTNGVVAPKKKLILSSADNPCFSFPTLEIANDGYYGQPKFVSCTGYNLTTAEPLVGGVYMTVSPITVTGSQEQQGLSELRLRAEQFVAPNDNYQARITLSPGIAELGQITFYQPLEVLQSAQACQPAITDVQVNGWTTNGLIVGTSGTINLLGTCLQDVNSVQIDAVGITKGTVSTTNALVTIDYSSTTSAATGPFSININNSLGGAAALLFATKLTVKQVSFDESLRIAQDHINGFSVVSNPVWRNTNPQDDDTYVNGANGRVAYVGGARLRRVWFSMFLHKYRSQYPTPE